VPVEQRLEGEDLAGSQPRLDHTTQLASDCNFPLTRGVAWCDESKWLYLPA
jgi:hypothetical protein